MPRIVALPGPGEKVLRFVGDRISFAAFPTDERDAAGSAFLRTNLGHAHSLRSEIIESLKGPPLLAGAAWRDVPMRWNGANWTLDLSMTQVGFFHAKPYFLDDEGRQHWPDGANIAISVHPDGYRTGNTIYCAFARLFGDSKRAQGPDTAAIDLQLAKLDKLGYTVIPASGKFRDLIREFPHIFDTLKCKILHLLPVSPTPTTYARFGRFGSPYAVEDMTAVDPALVEFDKRTTGIDQFRELTYAAHARGGKVFLDIVINHTGWGSTLQENHPEWFLKTGNGHFESPGAWGTVWEDLVELNHRIPDSWDYLADVFLTWCRRGVDGFRCDAGYKVPSRAWRYIIAKVREEFPESLFLLEGLGGAWEATETLLQEGGMQWAYSELFQNYSGLEVSGYLDHSHAQSATTGILAHYSETHDNDRLAKRGPVWARLRNALSALTSASGAYGFTCGVEWLSKDKIFVHQSPGLSWGQSENIVSELKQLNELLADHPCFFDGAILRRISGSESPVYALARTSAEGLDTVLVLVNLDPAQAHTLFLERESYRLIGEPKFDLILGTALVSQASNADAAVEFRLAPGGYHCLAQDPQPKGLSGNAYREARARAGWAIKALGARLAPEDVGPYNWRELAAMVETDAEGFLGLLPRLVPIAAASDLLQALAEARQSEGYRRVVTWTRADESRAVMAPPDHWLLVRDTVPFRATLQLKGRDTQLHVVSVPVRGGHIASFRPQVDEQTPVAGSASALDQCRGNALDAVLVLQRFGGEPIESRGRLQFLTHGSACDDRVTRSNLGYFATQSQPSSWTEPMTLLTNGIGGMARLAVDLGSVRSKYDCVLGANLHPLVPCDRHIFVKRVRVWINANGFISPLNAANLESFEPGPPAKWRFVGIAGAGNVVQIELTMDMLDQKNATALILHRSARPPAVGKALPADKNVRVIVRFDIEDRNFHTETKRNGGSEVHFSSNTRALTERPGFEFTPAADRKLRVFATAGAFHHGPEWSDNLPHTLEQTRGQTGAGDAYSPGWFSLPLPEGATETIIATADLETPLANLGELPLNGASAVSAVQRAALAPDDALGRRLALATQAFIVRRYKEKTVIAGYPWFLDWGRDSLICARGLLAAGLVDEVRELLITFGRFERDGTLPNTIHGEDASNRDTSDAPLWYGVVCEEAAQIIGPELYQLRVDDKGRTIADTLASLGKWYLRGTANGIKADEFSKLIWSPSHFTWMDTNYPAGTPREGYPIEIQALWIHLLNQLHRINAPAPQEGVTWQSLAEKAAESLRRFYWLEEEGWFADVIRARRDCPAHQGEIDRALRSNCLFAVTFGFADQIQAQRCVQAALRHLIIPGAIRSLAPLRAILPLAIYGNDGTLLNDPAAPYWGRYEGDEDTRRKPAYHNGTAWTWPFPTFCEALARAYRNEPCAVEAARAYLASSSQLLATGCVGQLPEVLDGDWPHQQRGCDAQAWGATEALRVWKLLNAAMR